MSCSTVISVDYGFSCSIKGVCKQLWIQNSYSLKISLYTVSKSVILNSSSLEFSPIDFCWDGHGEDLENSGLDLSTNNWDSWITLNSKKISILDPNGFIMESLPFNTQKSKILSSCCLEIPKEYRLQMSKNESTLQELREFINVNSRIYPDFFQEIQDSVSTWLKSSQLTQEYIKLSQEMP